MSQDDFDGHRFRCELYFREVKCRLEALAETYPELQQEPLWHELEQYAQHSIGRTIHELRFFGSAPRGTREQLRKWIATLRERTNGAGAGPTRPRGWSTWEDLERMLFGQLGRFSDSRYEADFF